jgi:glyceraldehyde 3-phosphate dehydrogenase
VKPLVSSDYIGDSRSSIIDAVSTLVINETQVKIYAWYDNEFGYSNRLVDVAELAGKFL